MTDVKFGPDWSAGFRRGSEQELKGWVTAALSWCDEGDRIALEHFRRGVAVEQKPDQTFVTVADRGVEQLVRERIADAYPDHGVVGEEFGVEAGSAATRWYIDPIDGTHNYIRGVPIFATLVAVERDGELQAAVISASALGERWWGWRGGGAWVSGGKRAAGPHRIAVSRIGKLEEAQVLFASATELQASGLTPGFSRLLASSWRERAFGDFWGYTLVSEGAAEVMVEPDLSPWDAAAPFLLVEEAGGRVTDFAGDRSIASRTFLATNGMLHDEVRSVLLGREENPP